MSSSGRGRVPCQVLSRQEGKDVGDYLVRDKVTAEEVRELLRSQGSRFATLERCMYCYGCCEFYYMIW